MLGLEDQPSSLDGGLAGDSGREVLQVDDPQAFEFLRKELRQFRGEAGFGRDLLLENECVRQADPLRREPDGERNRSPRCGSL